MATGTIKQDISNNRFTQGYFNSLANLITGITTRMTTNQIGIYACSATVGTSLTGVSGSCIVIVKIVTDSRYDYIALSGGTTLAIGRIDPTTSTVTVNATLS